MASFGRRCLIVLALFVLGGCNALMVPFYLFGPEPKYPAEYQPLVGGERKEARVAIVTYMGMEVNPDLLHADREVSRLLAKYLQELCTANGEKVTIVNPLKVEEYKNRHPDWHNLDLDEIGKQLKADFVVYLEINSLSLYQRNSGNTFYRGQAGMTVSLVDVNQPDDFTTTPKEFSFTYPGEARGGNRVVDADTPPHAFRTEFFNALSRRLSWYFTAHPTSEHYLCE